VAFVDHMAVTSYGVPRVYSSALDRFHASRSGLSLDMPLTSILHTSSLSALNGARIRQLGFAPALTAASEISEGSHEG
jgi:hypothetical protein